MKKRHIWADATTTLMYSVYIGYGMGTGTLFVRKIISCLDVSSVLQEEARFCESYCY